jgi:phosphatidylserine/phosphatidylglycerophosphate/cardiolipin synthase-like enzyme
MKTLVLRTLPAAALQALAALCRRGLFDNGMNPATLKQAVGFDCAGLGDEIGALLCGGFTPNTLAVLIESIQASRAEVSSPTDLFDLVLSGPDILGIPVSDTGAVMHTLIESARERIELIGYAIHNGRMLFERLAARMNANIGLEVVFCVDISRPRSDTSLDGEIIRRFTRDFWEKHWTWTPRPRLFFDPRSLSQDLIKRSSLHAKCIIVDRMTAFVTSANFTLAAHQRNIEVGILLRHGPTAATLSAFFESMRSTGALQEAKSRRLSVAKIALFWCISVPSRAFCDNPGFT